MFNHSLFILHTAYICFIVLYMVYLGKSALIALLSLLAVTMNLFILKQITLFHCDTTCCDPLAVGYLLGLNLCQEFFGRTTAMKAVSISLLMTLLFTGCLLFQLGYHPNAYDTMDHHYRMVLLPQGRILAASITAFLITQIYDITFFQFLKHRMQGRFLPLRTTLSLIGSQIVDTVSFTYLGLSSLIEHPLQMILCSITIKCSVVVITIPFVSLCKKIFPHAPSV